MPRINLRDWRKEDREEGKTLFVAMAVFSMIGAALIAYLVYSTIFGLRVHQDSRNQYLKDGIRMLDRKIVELGKLKKKRAQIIERMELVQSLESDRHLIVHVFDKIVEKIPQGVFFKKMSEKKSEISIEGKAQNNDYVSDLIRAFEQSPWFNHPVLTRIKAGKEKEDYKTFKMSVMKQNAHFQHGKYHELHKD